MLTTKLASIGPVISNIPSPSTTNVKSSALTTGTTLITSNVALFIEPV